MALFIPSKKPAMPAAHAPMPERPARVLKGWEGHVSKREIEHEVHHDLRKHGLSERDIAVVDAAVHNAIDERGSAKGMNAREVGETMEALHEDAPRLGLDKRDLGIIGKALEDRL